MGNLRPFRKRLTVRPITAGEMADAWKGWFWTIRLIDRWWKPSRWTPHYHLDMPRTPLRYHQWRLFLWWTRKPESDIDRGALTPWNMRIA